MASLLLLEDDTSLGQALKTLLEREGHSITYFSDLASAKAYIESNDCSQLAAAIVDVGLPDGDGFTFATSLKQKVPTPFIFLTARNDAEDRLQGFDLGAADYIPKPFHARELILRIQKVLALPITYTELRFGPIVIDKERRSISLPEERIEHPSMKDFAVLMLLINEAPKTVSREHILQTIWGASPEEVTTRTIDNCIVRLRDHLKEFGDSYIRSVRGVGYQWMAK